MEIRNIAIIAHVDHGKTALTDALMKQTGMINKDASMDSNDIEQERGITIYSKNTSLYYKDTKINIVDTPGHADFGSEVERVLRSIDSVILVVDAQEGPMPQTKFVLKKSLDLGLKPVVVINKIDKSAARPEVVKEMIYELFLDLGANDEQLNFDTIYSIAKDGVAKKELDDKSDDLTPLLEKIIEKVPVASSKDHTEKPLLAQPFNLAYDNFLGRLAILRVYQGVIKENLKVYVKDRSGETKEKKITKMFTFQGVERQETEEAVAGDIAMIAGISDIFIGDTICENQEQEALPFIDVDEPTISINVSVNDSPFSGRDGKKVTGRQIKERLEKELEVNVGLKIDFSNNDYYKVYGRGEMHLAILFENMRREGYEFQISQPNVVIKEEDGVKVEPFEEVTIIVSEESASAVIKKLSARKGSMVQMIPEPSSTKIVFEIPTRGLLGYRNEFVVDTRGEGIMYNNVIGFRPYVGEIKKVSTGSMVSMATGKVLGFSLDNLQNRGNLYVGPGAEVYEGMVIGDTSKGLDMAVNPTKGKQLTNVRSSSSDEAICLKPPTVITLEKGMSIMNNDEYLEITPKNIRLRKKMLTETERNRNKGKTLN
jgi:GTP-binding protein